MQVQRETICNIVLQKHLGRSQFLVHSPLYRSEEPLRSFASESCNSLILLRTTDHFTETREETFTALARTPYFHGIWLNIHPLSTNSQYFSFLHASASVAVIPSCINSLGSGDWEQEHPQP